MLLDSDLVADLMADGGTCSLVQVSSQDRPGSPMSIEYQVWATIQAGGEAAPPPQSAAVVTAEVELSVTFTNGSTARLESTVTRRPESESRLFVELDPGYAPNRPALQRCTLSPLN